MTVFKAAYMNELERMLRKNKIIIFVLLDIAICGLNILVLSLFRMSRIELRSESMATNVLTLFCSYVLPVYVVMITMEIFAAQYNDKTILNILARPITRFKIYLSKIAAVATFILFHLTVVLVIALILGFSNNIHILQLLGAYLVSAYPLIALAAMVALISQIVKNGLLGMLFCIILLIGTKALQIFLIMPAAFLFTTYLDWYKMFIMASPSAKHIVSTFVLISAYAVFTFVLGYLLFDKKEF